MPIINASKWKIILKHRIGSEYSLYTLNMTWLIAKYLEEDKLSLHYSNDILDINSPFGLICKADKTSGGLGTSAFNSEHIIQILDKCHSRGEEFKKASKE